MIKKTRLGTKLILTVTCMVMILFATSLWAADAPVTTAPSGSEPVVSLTEINKRLTNPVSDLWSTAFQQNNYMLDMGAGQPDHAHGYGSNYRRT